MKVDMSPEAVSGRLQLMGELWQLSVELMNSKPANGKRSRARGLTALEIQDSIRLVLMRDWDPIGVADVSGPADEYDAYISPLYRILVGARSTEDLMNCLRRIEREEMAISPSDPGKLRLVAVKLLELVVTLE